MSIYNSDGDNGSTTFDPGSVDLSSLDLSQLNQGNMLSTVDLINDPELFKAFATLYPEDAALLKENIKLPSEGGKEYVSQNPSGLTEPPSTTDPLDRFEEDTSVFDKSKNAESTGLKKILEEISKAIKGTIGVSGADLTKGLLAAYLAKKAYDEGQEARNYRRGATMGINAPVTATRNAFQGTKYSATGGGIGSLDMAQGRYLGGTTDGMADKIPAHIDNRRPAALSDGEFVIPADVVSHLGNGNSNAGAKRLYEMMDHIRGARTGNTKQGRQINPNKFLPR